MFTVLIADDESIIRRGLKKLIDWEELGFSIIGETDNGRSTLDFIVRHNPDVVLLDIKMPELNGLELIRRARASGFHGRVIILSGYADFSYAQEALQHNVSCYLCKPVEQKLLEHTLLDLKERLEQDITDSLSLTLYRKKAADAILREILTGRCDFTRLDLHDLNLDTGCLQVVIYENRHHSIQETAYPFAEILRVANKNQNTFVSVDLEGSHIVILKNEYAVTKFEELLSCYEREPKPQKNSPLDSLFLTYGRIVDQAQMLPQSYHDALSLMERRFFCNRETHTLGPSSLPASQDILPCVFSVEEALNRYGTAFCNFIQAWNQAGITRTLRSLEQELLSSPLTPYSVRLFLIDLMLRIKERLSHSFCSTDSLHSNSEIIRIFHNADYLYEILDFYSKEFGQILTDTQSSGKAGAIDNILSFIQNNYQENLRLEGIASAFGYNTSYLGQIFSTKAGCSFNAYLEKIRIENACVLLKNPSLKVYDVAEMVGYKNVDYFHLKFKKIMGMPPTNTGEIC